MQYTFNLDLKSFGIYPRQIDSLSGIITSPFIHGDFRHLISNSIPFFLLFTAIRFFYEKKSLQIILLVWLITGLSVWLGGRFAWHIGASGLIYAFFSFLFFSGILSKDKKLISISLLVIFFYGGMIWGIFPTTGNISWESHLYGFAVGFIIAFFFGKVDANQSLSKQTTEEDDFIEINHTHENEIEVNYDFKEKTGQN